MVKMKKFTKKQNSLYIALSERGACWDNLEDRPYDICAFDKKIWTHDKKSDRIVTAWAVGGMDAEPDYDVPLGKSPFNKKFATKYLAKRKEVEKEVIKLLKLFRLHESNAPAFEEVNYKFEYEELNLKNGTIHFWEENDKDGVEVGNYTWVSFDGGYDPLVVKLDNFKNVVKYIEDRIYVREKKNKRGHGYSKARGLLWKSIFKHSEPHKTTEGQKDNY
jgi:hypothetical protein